MEPGWYGRPAGTVKRERVAPDRRCQPQARFADRSVVIDRFVLRFRRLSYRPCTAVPGWCLDLTKVGQPSTSVPRRCLGLTCGP